MEFKYVLFFCLIAAIFADNENDPETQYKKFHEECQRNPATRISDSVLVKLRLGEKVEEPKMSSHLLCMMIKMGVQKENGDFDLEELRKAISEFKKDAGKPLGNDTVSEIVSKCGVRPAGSTAEEATMKLLLCIKEKTLTI